MLKPAAFVILCSILALSLTSCQERRQQRQLARDGNFCQSIGAKQGSPEFTQCMLQKDSQRQVQMTAAPVYVPMQSSRSVTCHTSAYGHTHCF